MPVFTPTLQQCAQYLGGSDLARRICWLKAGEPGNRTAQIKVSSPGVGMSIFESDIMTETNAQPRAQGRLLVSSKARDGKSVIDTLRTSGSFKALFPPAQGTLETIMINTSGGLTGGDRFDIDARAGRDTTLVLTTQAAERAYRASSATARVSAHLRAERGAFLCWLPQELIVYERAALARRLMIDLDDTARLLMVEPIVFGRSAMGERLTQIAFEDRIAITCAGRPLYMDTTRITDDALAHLGLAATAQGAKAVASVVYKSPDAEARLAQIRPLLNATAGASLIAEHTLVLRMLAPDSYLLRRTLIPVLELLKGGALPRSWSL